MTNQPPPSFTAIVLAADRTPGDPVARAAGVSCKALAPVEGRPMLFRVLDALEASTLVSSCILCGPPAPVIDREPLLRQRLASSGLTWLPPQATPSTSAASALGSIPGEMPVLLTTGDHALLTPPMVDHFCREAFSSGCDLVAALAPYALIMKNYPGMRRTRTRFSDGPFCGCNLFAFLTSAGRSAADLWRQVEKERKRPLKMIGRLGWIAVLRYLLGRLCLKDGLRLVSARMGIKVGAVILPFAEAAVDVDSVSDWHFAQAIASRVRSGQQGQE
jgi:CTP:molybdopterin cytidylyltransferase MocA